MKFKAMFQPIRIGQMEVKNRFVVPPMGTNYADSDGKVTDALVKYYGARAKGGFGLIIQEVAAIDPKGKAVPNQIGIWNDDFIPGLKRITDEVHKYNGKIIIQLHHAGRQTLPPNIGGKDPVAPSSVPCPFCDVLPHELTLEEIYDLIEKFGDAAVRAQKAGYDGVEIHGAHGYLIAQFVSPHANKRIDEFGGDFQGRLKFPLEIIKNIRKKVGGNFPIVYRMSAEEYVSGGMNIETAAAISRELEEAGVDAINISVGTYGSMPWVFVPSDVPPGFNQELSARIKDSVNIPVIVVGRMVTPYVANDVIEAGKADMVCFGRASLADPELPNKVAAGDIDKILPCIGCCQSCYGYLLDPEIGKVSCLVNPMTGKEYLNLDKPAEVKNNVFVVGGGPAGLYAALIAAKRGHNVTLYEKEKVLGGQFRIAGVPPTKHDILGMLKAYITLGKKYGVKYKTGVEVTEELILKENPDVVILATGGIPMYPDIPGLDENKVVNVCDILDFKVQPGKNVLILGGGLNGAETASYLSEHGRNVTIIEMLPEIAIDEELPPRYFLLERLKKNGVKCITNAKITKCLDDGVVYEIEGKEKTIRGFDTIVCALGVKSYNPLESVLKDKVKELYVIGDANKVDKANKAIEEALKVTVNL